MAKIPDNAKKVFEGILFDVYQWEQKMFDGSYATFEAIKKLASIQIIAITTNKKIILLNEEQPHNGKFISLPGGKLERSETPLENAQKELREETGMQAEIFEFYKETNFGSTINWPTYYYIARECKKVQDPELEPGEKITIMELNFDEFIAKTQVNTFRNKGFQEMIFKMIHTEDELEKFKNILFQNY